MQSLPFSILIRRQNDRLSLCPDGILEPKKITPASYSSNADFNSS